jgi:hypothetical protein
MRKLAALALIAVLGGGYYIIHDVGHIPIFDAGLNRLAETSAEAYCAGTTFWEHQGQADAADAKACRAQSDRPTEPDLQAVTPSFCQAVTDSGYEGGLDTCTGILEGQKLWPTYDGGLTNQWSEDSPYPADKAFAVPAGDSRTGTRDGFARGDEDTTETTETTVPEEETTTTEGEG